MVKNFARESSSSLIPINRVSVPASSLLRHLNGEHRGTSPLVVASVGDVVMCGKPFGSVIGVHSGFWQNPTLCVHFLASKRIVHNSWQTIKYDLRANIFASSNPRTSHAVYILFQVLDQYRFQVFIWRSSTASIRDQNYISVSDKTVYFLRLTYKVLDITFRKYCTQL